MTEILNMIRAEIKTMIDYHDCPIEIDYGNDYCYRQALITVLQIIDKYMTESVAADESK